MYCRKRIKLEKKKLKRHAGQEHGGRGRSFGRAGRQEIDQHDRQHRAGESADRDRRNAEERKRPRLRNADRGPQRRPAGNAERVGRGQRIAEHRLKNHPADGQRRARQKSHRHAGNAHHPKHVDRRPIVGRCAKARSSGIECRPTNGATSSVTIASSKSAQSTKAFVHGSASVEIRGTIIGMLACG